MSVPDWKRERMLLGDIPPEESEKDRLEELRRENEELLAAHPPAQVAREIQRRAGQVTLHRPSRPAIRIAAPVLAAAMAVLLFVALPEETERSKGAAPYLVIHRSAGDHADRLQPEARVKARDVLQVSYVALGRPYGLIFSIDGAGVTTLHHPFSKDGDQTLIDLDAAVPLPSAYELDDAPDFERFFFVTSTHPLDVDAILERARHHDLSGLEVSSFPLLKGAP